MTLDPFTFEVRVAPEHIDFLNRVFEAYDHLAVVSTVDRHEATLLIRGFGKRGPIRRILRGLPFPTEILREL